MSKRLFEKKTHRIPGACFEVYGDLSLPCIPPVHRRPKGRRGDGFLIWKMALPFAFIRVPSRLKMASGGLATPLKNQNEPNFSR